MWLCCYYENPACVPKVNVDCVLSCGEKKKQLVMVLNTPNLGNVLMMNLLTAVSLSLYAHSSFPIND